MAAHHSTWCLKAAKGVSRALSASMVRVTAADDSQVKPEPTLDRAATETLIHGPPRDVRRLLSLERSINAHDALGRTPLVLLASISSRAWSSALSRKTSEFKGGRSSTCQHRPTGPSGSMLVPARRSRELQPGEEGFRYLVDIETARLTYGKWIRLVCRICPEITF